MLKNLLVLCLVTLSLGQFSAIYKSEGINIYAFDIFVTLFAVYGIGYFLLKKSLVIEKESLLFILFSAVGFISLSIKLPEFENLEFLSFFFYLFRFVMYILTGVVMFNMLKQRIITKEFLFKLIVMSGIFISIAGFIQLIVLPDFETLDPSLGWDPHKNRLASTFFDPNFVGAYLNLCLVFILDKFSKSFNASKDFIYLYIFTLLTAATFLTFSRSSWAMFATVIFIYGIFKFKKLLLLSLLVGFLAYFAVPRIQTRISGVTDPSDSAQFRLVSWSHAMDIWRDNIFLGVGFNTYRFYQKEYGFFEIGSIGGNSGAGADSSLLLVAATTGIVGLVIFLGGFVLAIVKGFKRSNLLILSTVAGLFVHSLFVNSLFYPQILFLWPLILIL